MQITLIFMAIVMATIIGWLLKQSWNTQPWVSDEAADASSGQSLELNPKALGLTTFLAVAISLFALFVSAYTLRMEEVGRVRLRVELCTIYWHFLLLVWLVLFGLMLST